VSPLIVLFATPIFLGTLFGEAWLRKRRGLGFDAKDGMSSVGMGTGFGVLSLLLEGLTLSLFAFVYRYRVFDIGDAWWVWPVALVADDLVFYWAHRLEHEVRFLWATHEAHHSSEQYTFTTALRQPWTYPIGTVFWVPLALVGIRPEMILAAHSISLFYQYWIHTELVGKLGPLEWFLNTPSHHRVHHGSNPRYLDRNYAGILIVWDRLFGTFEPELETPRYGLTKPLLKRDVFHASFNEWIAIGKDLRRARTWRGRWNALFGRTGTDYLACEKDAALDTNAAPT
jgi:sterol desaturase/sphingolipid hydroxylase (fatty acid hydroxylase superfamily)